MRRRELLAAVTGLAACSTGFDEPDPEREYPPFLRGFEASHAEDPRAAGLAWFRSAGLGLFLEYGVYSQLGRGPFVQFDDRIPVARYGELGATFDPAGFDARRLADLAVECGARYIGLTARHADGFCLFRTIETDFNSLECSGRDLVGELAEACRQSELGLLLSYSYAADWRHPYFFPAETSTTGLAGGRGRPSRSPSRSTGSGRTRTSCTTCATHTTSCRRSPTAIHRSPEFAWGRWPATARAPTSSRSGRRIP